MSLKKRNIITSIIKRLSVLMVLIVLAVMISNIIVYFETTNEIIDDTSYVTEEEALHKPTIEWVSTTDVLGKKLANFQIEAIQKDYKNAWYRLNKSLRTNNDYGLKDYFSDSLSAQISQLFSSDFFVNQTDLSHQLSVHLISLGEIVVALKDKQVIQLKEVYKLDNPMPFFEQTDTLSFKILLKLTDGRWKIVEMVRESNELDNKDTLSDNYRTNVDLQEFQAIKGINYYPAKTPWHLFWKEFSPKVIDKDFKLINDLGYNTVRFFIPFFKKEQQQTTGFTIAKMDTLLAKAKKYNLQLIPTLFDFPQSFDLDYYTTSIDYVNQIIEPFRENKNIYAWDIKNEPDLDFEYHPPNKVKKFLTFISQHIKQKLRPIQPLTIGFMKAENAHLLQNEIDFITFHYYEAPQKFEATLKALKEKVNKPIMLGEFGQSSFAFWGNNKAEQQNYNSTINNLCEQHKIPHLVWTLHNFENIPDGVFGLNPMIKWQQSKFGIYP